MINKKGMTKATAAAKAGMCEKTARKYLKSDLLPSQTKKVRTWRTREDPFAEVWPEIETMLCIDGSLMAKTVFDYLCRKHPGKFQEGQLRTLQRKMKNWKVEKGPAREVMFPQERSPGVQCQSDFTCMNDLNVLIANQPFDHLLYHFVLPYSKWEWGEVCFSESMEALRGGLQNALWTLGGVPREHRTDNLGAAIKNSGDTKEFNAAYQGVMDHYRMKPSRNYPGNGHENGSVEQAHYRLKLAIDQELLLRGSRNFKDRARYTQFLQDLMIRRNKGRQARLTDEMGVLGELPSKRLEDFNVVEVRVSKFSTISVRRNAYSIDSRLIGHKVKVRIYADVLEVWFNQRKIETLPRLRGRGGHHINYRHVIESLVRKPGAFADYKYRSDMFPRFNFKLAYDWLQQHRGAQADSEYVQILYLAAQHSEEKVGQACRSLLKSGKGLTRKAVVAAMGSNREPEVIMLAPPTAHPADYDGLLGGDHVN